jgi:hypothetical protein
VFIYIIPFVLVGCGVFGVNNKQSAGHKRPLVDNGGCVCVSPVLLTCRQARRAADSIVEKPNKNDIF